MSSTALPVLYSSTRRWPLLGHLAIANGARLRIVFGGSCVFFGSRSRDAVGWLPACLCGNSTVRVGASPGVLSYGRAILAHLRGFKFSS